MDVKTVCLGMLNDDEASGYDLKKHFESTFAHFFAAGYGSIYPALSSLAAAGLVDCREIAQDGKPDRKVYRITSAGRAHFLKALEKPAPKLRILTYDDLIASARANLERLFGPLGIVAVNAELYFFK